MKNISKTLLLLVLSIAVSSLTLQSCKKKFDEPPTGDYPVLETNTTISQIKALHTVGNNPDAITQDLVFEGIVVSSDEAGNFYKQLIIQDDSAGIEIRVEQSNLYNDYPVGRRVYVKCNGLYVGDYEGNHQITINAAGDRIPGNMLGQYVIGGALNQPVVAQNLTIAQIRASTRYRNMLVQIDGAQFAALDTAKTYADAITGQSQNRTVADCAGGTMLLRSSAYATFVNDLTPGGNGTITAVHSNFGSDAQLYIRDTRDINFTSSRCSVTLSGNLISINDVRAAFPSGNAPSNSRVRGYVISDRTTDNIVSQSCVVMDENGLGGIVLRFSTAHSLNEGDYIEFSTDGATLTDFSGLMQMEGISSGNISVISSGNAVPGVVTTVANLNTNAESFESMLVQVQNASISAGTFSGTRTLSDASGSIDLYTRFGATFAGDPVPCGNLSVTAIVGQFTSYQLSLRNPTTDISGGTSCSGSATLTNIAAVRAQFTGTATTVTGSLKIKGTVISDRVNKNIFDDNFVIQDSTGGIQIRMTANHSYNLGDELEITITGASLGESSSLLRLGNSGGIASANVTVLSTGNTPTFRTATVAQVLANAEAWESSLVRITGSTITGGSGNYGFNTLTDATGSIDLYTASAALFFGTAYPTGTVTVTSIVGQFNATRQLRMRNSGDAL